MRNRIVANEGASTYIFCLCGASLVGNLFAMLMSGRMGDFAGMSIANWVSYAIMQLAFIGVVFIMGVWRKFDPLKVARIRPSRNWKHYVLLPFIALFTILAFYPLSLLFLKFLSVIGYHGGGVAVPQFTSVGVYFLAIFVIAVLPAIGEELMCRGILCSGLSTRSVPFGILISAFLFSFMHANPLQTVHQFGLGVVSAILFILSGSLLPSIILHFLNNFYTLTITAYIPEVDMLIYRLGNWNYLTGAVSVVVGLVGLAVLLYLYHRAGQKKKAPAFKVFENSGVFEEYTIIATMDEEGKKTNIFLDTFRFVGSLFTKRGWQEVRRVLTNSADVPMIGNAQPMISVWLAIGFAAFYWVVNFVLGMI